MADRTLIRADDDFVKEVMASGGDSLKKCFQCGTCSVVCNLSPEQSTFPRREMIWAQWGLKDKLATDPNVWLCYQCNDCSTYCPRGAKPGDVLGALRKMQISQLSFPSFMAKAVNDSKYLVLMLLFPAVLLVLALYFGLANLSFKVGNLHIPEGPVHYGEMFSHTFIIVFYNFFVGLAGLAFLGGILKLLKSMAGDKKIDYVKLVTLGMIPTIIEILTHKNFDDCTENNWRRIAHMCVLGGFIALMITTAAGIFYILLKLAYPMAILNPFKILGNIGAIALFVGVSWMLYVRYQNENDTSSGASKSSYFDWVFAWVLWLVALTGIGTEVCRLVEAGNIAYYVYFVHLVAVFFLLVYSPYSKFAHLIYRTIAMTYQRYKEATEGSATAQIPSDAATAEAGAE